MAILEHILNAETVGVGEGVIALVFRKVDFPRIADAGRIDAFITQRYPDLISRNPGTEDNPLVNGVSVTPHEIAIICNEEPLQEVIDDIKTRLEQRNWG